MPKTDLNLGAKLTQQLEKTGLSNAEIARHFDVSRQAIGEWKRTGRIAKSRLPALAKLTGTSLSWWVGDDEEPVEPLEQQLLKLYRELSDDFKERLLADANKLHAYEHPEVSASNPYPLAPPPGNARKPKK